MDIQNFSIPDSNEPLIVIASLDEYETLVKKYNQIYRQINGQTISDIFQVYNELKDWISIERAELIIPYLYANQRKEPIGHRVWYLSQQDKASKYYNGCFFDLKITNTKQRIIRKQCKLSGATIKLFQKHPEIQNNERIKNDD